PLERIWRRRLAEAEVDARPVAGRTRPADLPRQPVDQPVDLRAAWERGREAQLAAQAQLPLEEADVMTAQRGDPSRLHAGRAAADHGDAQRPGGRLDLGVGLGPLAFATRGRPADTTDGEPPPEVIEAALVGADAGPDGFELPGAR